MEAEQTQEQEQQPEQAPVPTQPETKGELRYGQIRQPRKVSSKPRK